MSNAPVGPTIAQQPAATAARESTKGNEEKLLRQRHVTRSDMVFAAIAGIMLLVAMILAYNLLEISKSEPALCIAAIAPAILVLQHGLQLRFFRPELDGRNERLLEVPTESLTVLSMPSARPTAAHSQVRRECIRRVRKKITTQFSWWAIALDYMFPMALTAAGGIIPTLMILRADVLIHYVGGPA